MYQFLRNGILFLIATQFIFDRSNTSKTVVKLLDDQVRRIQEEAICKENAQKDYQEQLSLAQEKFKKATPPSSEASLFRGFDAEERMGKR